MKHIASGSYTKVKDDKKYQRCSEEIVAANNYDCDRWVIDKPQTCEGYTQKTAKLNKATPILVKSENQPCSLDERSNSHAQAH